MKKTAAVIDFGTSKIVTVIADSATFSRCEIRGTGTVPYAGYQSGKWIEPIELPGLIKQSIAAAELEAKMTIKEIFVTVPAERFRVLCADTECGIAGQDNRVTGDDMDAVQDAGARALELGSEHGCIIQRSPAWFQIDNQKKTMTPCQKNKKGYTIRALTSFIVADSSFVLEMRELFKSMNIEVCGFVSSALCSALRSIPSVDLDETVALVDVGYLNTEISVLEGDAIVYHEVLPVGGGFITADIAENLQLDMDAAEKIKREFSFDVDELTEYPVYSVVQDGSQLDYPMEVVAMAMARTMDELLEGISESLNKAGTALNAGAKVYLTGGGLTPMKGSAGWLADKIGRTVVPIQDKGSKLGGCCFASVLGAIDQIFASIEEKTVQQESFPGRLTGTVKNFLRRDNNQNVNNETEDTSDNE